MIIKDLRTKKGFSQFDLALAVGVSQSMVSKWEKGVNTPRPKYLKKLSELFGCTIDELVKG